MLILISFPQGYIVFPVFSSDAVSQLCHQVIQLCEENLTFSLKEAWRGGKKERKENPLQIDLLFKKEFICLYRQEKGWRKRGKETSMCERNIDELPLARPQMGTWPAIQACALTASKPMTF